MSDAVSTKRVPDQERAGWRSVAPLGIGAFAIGTDLFVVAGVLPNLAADLDVTVGAAGLTVTVFALAYATGAPVLSALLGARPLATGADRLAGAVRAVQRGVGARTQHCGVARSPGAGRARRVGLRPGCRVGGGRVGAGEPTAVERSAWSWPARRSPRVLGAPLGVLLASHALVAGGVRAGRGARGGHRPRPVAQRRRGPPTRSTLSRAATTDALPGRRRNARRDVPGDDRLEQRVHLPGRAPGCRDRTRRARAVHRGASGSAAWWAPGGAGPRPTAVAAAGSPCWRWPCWRRVSRRSRCVATTAAGPLTIVVGWGIAAWGFVSAQQHADDRTRRAVPAPLLLALNSSAIHLGFAAGALLGGLVVDTAGAGSLWMLAVACCGAGLALHGILMREVRP